MQPPKQVQLHQRAPMAALITRQQRQQQMHAHIRRQRRQRQRQIQEHQQLQPPTMQTAWLEVIPRQMVPQQ